MPNTHDLRGRKLFDDSLNPYERYAARLIFNNPKYRERIDRRNEREMRMKRWKEDD